jgi:hypothetical protein
MNQCEAAYTHKMVTSLNCSWDISSSRVKLYIMLYRILKHVATNIYTDPYPIYILHIGFRIAEHAFNTVKPKLFCIIPKNQVLASKRTLLSHED